MKQFLLVFAFIFSSQLVLAQDIKKFSFLTNNRFAINYAMNEFKDIKATNINQFKWAHGVNLDYEFGAPLVIVSGLNYFQNKDVQVSWKGSPNTPVELYGYLVKLGLKILLPIGFFQPWVGGGYSFGVITYSNTRDRETSNFSVVLYSRGSQTVKQFYTTAGLDIALGSSGIRLGAEQRSIRTALVSEIGDQPYDAEIVTYSAGVFTNF